jgi:hypothetical protein
MPNELNPEGSLEQPDQEARIEGSNTADLEMVAEPTLLEEINRKIAEFESLVNLEQILEEDRPEGEPIYGGGSTKPPPGPRPKDD